MMNEPIYTLHAGSQTFKGTAMELEAIRAALTRDAHEHWAAWSETEAPSRMDVDISAAELKSA